MRPQDLIGHDVYDPDGRKIGRVGTVYLDGATREPGWVTVRTGLFGHRESFVPLAGAHPGAEGVQVEVALDVVKDAPQAEGALSAETATELYRYYGLPDAPPPIPLQRIPKPSDMPRKAPTSPATP
ncbi:PRC-barrel domain-containing protein [Alloactinosynnema sp. L-07]|uniref:PRC-barrel domain-containing protein n=1 Tax=Alloactinosynnema sp. L-07 TaxID=1653480 RepID=UPI0012FA7BA0|nr:PRC-barrel domain-containing protein [Alloactinosynnema sp. L-07]